MNRTDGEKPADKTCLISVIIVTYNRRNLVTQCLQSLLTQSRRDGYEVIVVDNRSDDGTPAAIRQSCPAVVRCITCSKRESVAACKRRALEQSRGEIVAFIDDDCTADEHWLRSIAAAGREYDLVGGPVLSCPGTVFPRWWRESLAWLVGLNPRPNRSFLPLGSNIAGKKEVFVRGEATAERSAARDAYLLPYAEDNYRLKKALALGYSLGIIDAMKVYHHISPARLSLRYLMQRSFREGQALAVWEPAKRDLAWHAIKMLAGPLRFLVSGDLNRLLRTIVSFSYLIHYPRSQHR